jgi:hypothetical protein
MNYLIDNIPLKKIRSLRLTGKHTSVPVDDGRVGERKTIVRKNGMKFELKNGIYF